MVKVAFSAPPVSDKGMNVLLVGDLHADLAWAMVVVGMAIKNECSLILQLGDFGFFPNLWWGQQYLAGLQQALACFGLPLYFVDGNHDNHVWLRDLPAMPGSDLVKVTNNVFYIPRGTRWEWAGKTFLALGGGYSLDAEDRTEGVDWWSEELITYGEVVRACEGGKVDVMVTHDAPYGVRGCTNPNRDNKDIFLESLENRKLLRSVLDQVRPTALYHGHYHWRYTEILRGDDYRTEVVGLAHNGYPGSFEVLRVGEPASVRS